MISVVIPTYNRGKTIVRAVESVLQQTYKNIECIIVDDASTDDTESKIHKIEDSRLHYKKLSENHGACYARNVGVKVAKGEYIAFQDSDDFWLPDKLEKQIAFLKKTKSDVVFCQLLSKNLKTNRNYYFPNRLFSNSRINRKKILAGNFASTQTLLGKRNCFLQHPFDINLPRMQDWDLMIAMVDQYKISYLREILVHSFIGQDSITNNPEKGIVSCQYLLEKWKDLYNDNPRCVSALYVLFANFRMQKGEKIYKDIWMAFRYNPFNLKIWMIFFRNIALRKTYGRY